MKEKVKALRKRLLGGILCASMLVMCFASATAHAAGVETLERGDTYMGSFSFKNNNTTPTKTINGTHVKVFVSWRKADGQYGSPNLDTGIGDVKLTLSLLNNSGSTLKSTVKSFSSSEATNGYITTSIDLDVSYGQQIKIFTDASSVGSSNGNYRSIYIRSLWAIVT